MQPFAFIPFPQFLVDSRDGTGLAASRLVFSGRRHQGKAAPPLSSTLSSHPLGLRVLILAQFLRGLFSYLPSTIPNLLVLAQKIGTVIVSKDIGSLGTGGSDPGFQRGAFSSNVSNIFLSGSFMACFVHDGFFSLYWYQSAFLS